MKVIVYHKVSNKKQFEKQIQYLISNYEIINPLMLEDYINKKKILPDNALMITFDDGDFSIYRNAFPILKAEKIPAIIFVVTALIETEKPFWWDEIEYFLGGEDGDEKVWEVKKWPNANREVFLKELRRKSNKPTFKYQQLTIKELREMHESGILIANHSHTHPMFDKCTPKELELEMQHSNKILDNNGFSSDMFAYPNGNFSDESEMILKKYGVKIAFLFNHQQNREFDNPLRISRLIVNDNTPMWKFKFILSGWHTKILPLTKALGKLRK